MWCYRRRTLITELWFYGVLYKASELIATLLMYIMEIRYTTNVPGSQQLRGQDGKPEQEQRAEPYIEKQVVGTNKCKRGAEGNGMP